MNSAVIAILVVAVVAVGGGAAYAAGVFEGKDDGGSDDDWRSHIGEYTTYETAGKMIQVSGFFTITTTWTGTATNTLLYMDEDTGWWYINYYIKNTYSRGWDTWTYEGDSSEWGMSEDYTEEDLGEVTIKTKYYGEKTCRHILLKNESTGHTENQYIGVDDGIAYYVLATTVSGIDDSRTEQTTNMYYKGSGKTSVDVDFDVSLYADGGIEVTGSGTYAIGQTVTVTAEGDDFFGWYDFDTSVDTPVSKDREYKFTIKSDKTLYALTGAADTSYESGEPVTLKSGKDLSDAEWTIIMYDRTLGKEVSEDTATGAEPTYTFDLPGDYRIRIDGTTTDGEEYHGYRILFVDGEKTNTYTYEVNNVRYTFEMGILFSDYVDSMDSMDVSERRDDRSNRQEHAAGFVIADTVYIKQLADHFLGLGLKDSETLAAVLSMTQYITYALDSSTHGVSEYWNFPIETLYLNAGDCEDTSILCSAIYKALGFQSALILMSGHMAVGFLGTDMDDYSQWVAATGYARYDRSGYYYGETTSTSYALGEIPKDVAYVDTIKIGTGYDEKDRTIQGAPPPSNRFPSDNPDREYISSSDIRRTLGSFLAISLRSTENPAAENMAYSLLDPFMALDLSFRTS